MLYLSRASLLFGRQDLLWNKEGGRSCGRTSKQTHFRRKERMKVSLCQHHLERCRHDLDDCGNRQHRWPLFLFSAEAVS